MKTAVSAALVLLLAAALLCGGAAGVTEVTVTTEAELIANFTDDHVVKLGNDIYQTDSLSLLSGAVTLDLNGHNLTADVNKCLFTINGGTFTLMGTGGGYLVGNGTVNSNGGGVSVSSGTFIMNSGSIVNCSAKYGGGVYIQNSGRFTMSGGSIVNCSAAKKGGGVYVQNSGRFTMSGGSIVNCSVTLDGGGVYVHSGMFDVSGTAEITGNTNSSSPNNVYLTGNNMLTLLAGGFTGKVGISSPVGLRTQFGLAEADASGEENFISDIEGYLGEISDTQHLVWNATEYSITYELNGGTNAETNPASYNITTDTVTLADASRTGYTFEGWYNSSVFTEAGRNNTIPAGSTGDRTFCANYTAHTYNVTFNNNTGVGIMEDQTFTYDAAQTLTAVTFTKSGFTFAGWNATDADGTAVDYADQATVMNLTADDKETVTLYAVWTEIPPAPPEPSKSSRDYGTSVWLTATPTPTPVPTNAVPTAEPTQGAPSVSPVNPQPTQTSSSPAPFIGILAGLGAAAAVAVLRRK